MTPYSYLLAYTYASGLPQFLDGMGGGGMTAATSIGSRLDYAVAANLELVRDIFLGLERRRMACGSVDH